MSSKQSIGREKNGAAPGGRPDASTSDADVEATGRRETESAGPDGPDVSEVAETFKKPPGASR